MLCLFDFILEEETWIVWALITQCRYRKDRSLNEKILDKLNCFHIVTNKGYYIRNGSNHWEKIVKNKPKKISDSECLRMERMFKKHMGFLNQIIWKIKILICKIRSEC